MNGDSVGSRWWRFDFHTHTPASPDYGKGPNQQQCVGVPARDWLLDYMRAGIDCVAITDHNSGAWIGPLQSAYRDLEREGPGDFRPLVIFPGTEITVHGGYHLLAILDPAASGDDIVSLLGALGIPASEQGAPGAASGQPLVEAAKIVTENGGLAVPAHVDGPAGIFEDRDGEPALRGGSLQELLDCENVLAMELTDFGSQLPSAYSASRTQWAEVLGSDSHHPAGAGVGRAPGERYTWVKMGTPSLAGLRLALLDRAPLSILRSDEAEDDPNLHARLYIEGVELSEGQYAGRGTPLKAGFSPWLSAIIGGRGSGKSTLIEMMRLGLRRETDHPDTISEDLKHFQEVPHARGDRGALTAQTEIIVTVSKEDEKFRIRWRQDGTGDSVIEQRTNDSWLPSPGEVSSRFPVRILSQKQVFSMAGNPGSLLRLIDESPEVAKREWDARYEEARTRFLSLRSQARALAARLGDRQRIEGDLADVKRQLAVFEEGGHRDLLVQLRRLVRQRRAMDERRAELVGAVETVRSVSQRIGPSDLPEADFAGGTQAEVEAVGLLRDAASTQEELRCGICRLADAAAESLEDWESSLAASDWASLERETHQAYEALVERLKREGVSDPSGYGVLVHARQQLEAQLADLAAVEEERQKAMSDALCTLEKVAELRSELSDRRARFLADVLDDNEFVRIEVRPYGETPREAEPAFRTAIDRLDGRLADDILSTDRGKGLLAELFRSLPNGLEERREALAIRIARIKEELLTIWATGQEGQRSRWMRNHLRELSPEQIDRLELWWPEDELRVEYRRAGEAAFTPISQGSPGQKSAAMLAFLLSHGEEPIILDQPEDDLDNRLVSDLVVAQLRKGKRARQVIVATHNPNIVVNGDAEMVVSMAHGGGQCHVLGDRSGCLQDRDVRREVCAVMEGGQEAFDSRYRRLREEPPGA